MPAKQFPAHLPGANVQYPAMRGITRRLHNRRVSMIITPAGEYQIHLAKVLGPGEADEMRQLGHRDTLDDYIVRDKVRYSIIGLTQEAFEAAIWCKEKLEAKRQRKR